MFKEYFGLTVKETFLTWSLLETIISVSGIIFILFISLFVYNVECKCKATPTSFLLTLI